MNEMFSSLSKGLNETPFLRAHRQSAFTALQHYSVPVAGVHLPSKADLKDEIGGAYSLQEGIVAGIFAQLATGDIAPEYVKIFEKHFAKLLPSAADKPEVLRHYAFLNHGQFFYVKPGTILEKPIQMTIRNAGKWGGSHVVLVVGKGAKVTFTEHLANDMGGIDREPSGDNTGLWSHVTEVFVEEEAECTYVSLQHTDPGAQLWCQQRSSVESGGKIHWHNSTLGAGKVAHDLVSTIPGADATSSIDWLFYAKDTEQQRLSVRNIFDGRNGGGEITLKGVAEGKAHAVCNGMIEIGLQGGGTNTYLTENVLMLDKTAKVDAIPGLEIKTNDVKASHSATVSRVTAEDLFYFGARGIDNEEARRMYIEGFLGDLTQRIGDSALAETVMAAVRGKYGRL